MSGARTVKEGAPSKKLILASASPRRRELLRGLGSLEFEVVPAQVDETLPFGMEPRETAIYLAWKKGAQVAAMRPDDWVLAADTVVDLDGFAFGKPVDEGHALAMLELLSARTHTVITAFCLINQALGRSRCEAVETRVSFRAVEEAELAAYVASGEPLDKAGAYAVQGGAAGFVEAVEGSYSNVVGLPLERLAEVLREEGLLPGEGP